MYPYVKQSSKAKACTAVHQKVDLRPKILINKKDILRKHINSSLRGCNNHEKNC